jgi:aromatic-L-amino-acid decarboxylase
MQQQLVDAINDDGRIYLTQSIWQDQKVIRFQVGQFDCTHEDVMLAHTVIKEVYARMV